MRTVSGETLYEVYAVRYATREGRRGDHFIGGDPHDAPMPMDYYVWVARSAERVFVVDAGFTKEVAAKRKREFLRCPADALRLIDVQPEAVSDVVLTHLHYDHVGNVHKFPGARFHVQEKEMAYATGKYMRYRRFGHGYEIDDVVGLVRLSFEGRVEFHDGTEELADGLSVHLVGGHTAGLQFVRVRTRRGFVVLASDASHFYENMLTDRPFTTAFHVAEMVDAFRALERMASSREHIVPGHDPLVMERYRAPETRLEGIVVRLD